MSKRERGCIYSVTAYCYRSVFTSVRQLHGTVIGLSCVVSNVP